LRRIIDGVPSARTPPKIFISYRRDDAAGEAGRLADHLSRRFGAGAVFLDIETIDPGTDFVSVLHTTLQQTAAVLVIIGTRWISLRGASGTRRLDDEHDFVRLEVEKALGRGIPVVPVLVQGAPLPSAAELPPSIAALASRQTAVIEHSEFHADADRLCDRLEAMLAGGRGRQDGWRRWWPLLGGIAALMLALAGFAAWRTSTSEHPAAPDASPVADTSKDAGPPEAVRSLLVQAEARRRRAQFADALTTLAAARKIAPSAGEIRRVQEDVAMEWVRDVRLEKPEAGFGETIMPAMAIIDASLADAAGHRRADLLAHSGWTTFLMWRDGNHQLDPGEWYQQALAVEPDNPYANAMLAHWILFRGGDLTRAAKLFDAALRSQRDVTSVRALQWAALGNHRTPEADAERVRVADAMRRESRPLLERQLSALWSPYYFATLSGRDEERRMLLAAVPPDDHIATLRWAFKEYAANDESKQRTIRYYVALLDASAGRTTEAIQELRQLNTEVADSDGSFRDAVRAALRQLQGGRGVRPSD
jgi:tetratricopeptide (TPR) repeat protein